MRRPLSPTLWDIKQITTERALAVAGFGFTERQARFLVEVMIHSGVFVPRQYCRFAGIVHGQRTHDFLKKLVERGYAVPIQIGQLHRGRLFHVRYKPLYAAIGQTDNRHSKPASLARLVERVMILDAVLADRTVSWLGTEADKVSYTKGLDTSDADACVNSFIANAISDDSCKERRRSVPLTRISPDHRQHLNESVSDPSGGGPCGPASKIGGSLTLSFVCRRRSRRTPSWTPP